jgi:hypothetical protein
MSLAFNAAYLDNAEFYDLALEQAQRPAGAPLRRLGARQGHQLGFLLAVENRSNGRCHAPFAAQHRFEALFHQLLAYPVDHGRTGVQGLDDPAVAPAFAGLRDIGLQQPLRRALWISACICSRSPALNRTTYFFNEMSFPPCPPPSPNRDRSESSIPFKLVEAGD